MKSNLYLHNCVVTSKSCLNTTVCHDNVIMLPHCEGSQHASPLNTPKLFLTHSLSLTLTLPASLSFSLFTSFPLLLFFYSLPKSKKPSPHSFLKHLLCLPFLCFLCLSLCMSLPLKIPKISDEFQTKKLRFPPSICSTATETKQVLRLYVKHGLGLTLKLLFYINVSR